MKQDFDLHIHTTYSDGQYNLKDTLEKIKESKIKVFSITDHDSIDSIKEIANYDLYDMKYIKGVEISSILDNKYKLHILGYFIDENNFALNSLINNLKKARQKRFVELADYVSRNYGLEFNEDDIKEIIENLNIPGKPHLAKLMIRYHYVNSVSEAFEKYLENAKTITSNRAPADQVIKAIKDSGGVAIWAHPKKVEKQYGINFESLMPRLLELGIDGIEPFNSLHSYSDCMRYLSVAKQNKLLVSGGSDYHGESIKPDIKLGVIYNSNENIKIEISEINLLEVNRNEYCK